MTNKSILEKAIKNTSGYSVTSEGAVISTKSGIRKLLKYDTANGYFRVGLTIGGKTKKFYVHRLVAQCFIPNINHKPSVNHIDGNKKNNAANNLEWCTQKENVAHAWRTKLLPHPPFVPGEKAGNHKLTFAQVNDIRQRKTKGFTNTSLAKIFGVHHSTIARISNGETWKPEYLGEHLYE